MMRPWRVWAIGVLCAVVLLGAVGWLSLTVMRLEDEAAAVQGRALVEDNVRLALWRAESLITPLLARENARPYFVYSAFYPAEGAYGAMFNSFDNNALLATSPLAEAPADEVRLYFQIDSTGAVTSPQVSQGVDVAQYMEPGAKDATELALRLGELRSWLTFDDEVASLPLDEAGGVDVGMRRRRTPNPPASPVGQPAQGLAQQQLAQQLERNYAEQQARGKAASSGNVRNEGGNRQTTPMGDVVTGPLTPLWRRGELLLARRVDVGGRRYVQGCWLNWPVLERRLSEAVADLFPAARFEPAGDDAVAGRTLASLPVRLEPGPLAIELLPLPSPVGRFLAVMWVCVLLAGGAALALLIGLTLLSERRASFVSAVTHELRTPLTTFRLYTDMLADDLVADDDKRRQYYETLRRESLRLARLVENVLTYARLERRRPTAHGAPVSLGDLLERAREPLEERARQDDMRLSVELGAAAHGDVVVLADFDSVEQILVNLVDNACKYAHDAAERTIRITSSLTRGCVALRVRDYGPGLPRGAARRVFRPFRRLRDDRASAASGVGLGLALSQRLARRLGGDLRVVAPADGGLGACLELRLRVTE